MAFVFTVLASAMLFSAAQNISTIFYDALKEPCLLLNPLVTGKFGLRFYAGAPIVTEDGFAIGTVCVVDKEPRAFERICRYSDERN